MRENPQPIRQLGIIAGGGLMPEKLSQACESKGIEPFIIGFEGQTDPLLVKNRNHIWTRLGAAGHIIKTLRSHEIKDLVMIGSIRRPSLAELRPDLEGAKVFAQITLRAIGDNDLLGILREYLQQEGFTLHGVHKFADDLLTSEGPVGRSKPKKDEWQDIRRGFEVSQAIGSLDIGQSVIVQEGIVLGIEAAEGTDELIRRCRHLHRKGRGGILVKTCKPQQDRDFDLPTIGPETVKQAAENGLAGIAVQARLSLLIDPEKVAEIADRHKIFVIGVDPASLPT